LRRGVARARRHPGDGEARDLHGAGAGARPAPAVRRQRRPVPALAARGVAGGEGAMSDAAGRRPRPQPRGAAAAAPRGARARPDEALPVVGPLLLAAWAGFLLLAPPADNRVWALDGFRSVAPAGRVLLVLAALLA